jgi:hypothetical protein
MTVVAVIPVLPLLLILACGHSSSSTSSTSTDTAAGPSATTSANTSTDSAASSPIGIGTSANASTVTTVADIGLSSPENLVYDAKSDVYLIANINGDPRARDANGFISRVAPDGKVENLKWIDGARAATRLDGPKGLAIRGDTLAVADVGAVRFFDRRTGASLGVRTIPGEMMNDVAFGSDGSVYVTDTGPDPGKPDTADHDAIYRIGRSGQVSAVATGADLSGPDGLVVADSGLIYATFHARKVEEMPTAGGARHVVATLPGGKVDGLRQLPNHSYVVTSWDARTVYGMRSNGTLRPLLTDVTSPAGVAYDTKRETLAVTSMQDNKLYLLPLR